MPVQTIAPHSLTLVPPLDMPLSLRTESGRFSAIRPKDLPRRPPCTQNYTLPEELEDDYDYPRFHLHYGIDLNASPGDCVYAAYGGRVAEVNRGETGGNITIDHHPAGFGYTTKYIHITKIGVKVGQKVQQGQPIAVVADITKNDEDKEPHLHFSLWLVVDQERVDGAINRLIPVDPTRWLYRWEREFLSDHEMFAGPKVPQKIAVVQIHRLPFFQVVFDTPVEASGEEGDVAGSPDAVVIPPIQIAPSYYIPLYEPADLDERLMVKMLRKAFINRREVDIHYRNSAFFNRRIISQVIVK